MVSGRTLGGERHEDIPVDAAAHLGLAALDEQIAAAPDGSGDGEAVIVVVRGLDAAGLKERAGTEDAVAMRLVDGAVDAGAAGERDVEDGGGRVSEFGAEIAALGTEDLDDRGGGAEAEVEFFERVVIDEIELNVLVAAALSGGGVGFAEEVELDAAVGIGRRLGWGRGSLDLGDLLGYSGQGKEKGNQAHSIRG